LSNHRIYRVGRLTDKQIYRLFKEVQKLYDEAEAIFVIANNIKLSLAAFEKEKFPRTSYIVINGTFNIRSKSISLEFRRGISEKDFNQRIPSATADELMLIANNGQYNNAELADVIAISRIVENVTEPFGLEATDETLSPTLMLDAKLASLSELAADLIAGADQKRRELDSLRETLETEFQEKRRQFATEEQELRDEIAQKAKDVENLRAELDDREHKHVRRELRETKTGQIRESLGKHSGSAYSRLYSMQVTTFCIFGAVAAGLFAYWTQSTISSGLLTTNYDETGSVIGQQAATGFPVYMLYLKLFLSSAASVGFVVYAISWVKKLANQEAAHSQSLEQYVFDMNRASWTIETILELTDAELDEVPKVWLDSACRNLFERQDNIHDEATSLQALAALLNVTTEAEIGPDGPTFKLNKRAARKAAATAE